MTFLFSARYALLTYAQCGDLDEWAVSNHLSALGAECIIGREDHADGGTHLHVFLDFGGKKQSRRPNFFDVGGHHPNIAPSRGRPELGYDYAIKDGNVVAGGLARPGGGGLPQVADKWREIVSAESRDEFFDLLRQLDPKTLVTRWTELNKYADAAYAPIPEPYVGSDGKQFELGMVPELARWGGQLAANDPVEGRMRSLVLYGPSRLGKTVWARSLGPHVYSMGIVSGKLLLRDAPGAAYAVFDDMRGGIGYFHSWKEWLGAQSVVTVKELYRDPVQLVWGRPCIWLANRDPRLELWAELTDRSASSKRDMIQSDVDWLEANCVFVELHEPIFRANTE
ncbi:replication-associated protein [Capybara genomovirus 11]|nr:replication-associated protein [Capybara genomovirus 11]